MNQEELKKRRKLAYREAKARRDADPAYQAMKEKAKIDRKAHYRSIKDAIKSEKQLEKKMRQAEKDAALMALIKPASSLEENYNEKIFTK